jgi:heme A synthase
MTGDPGTDKKIPVSLLENLMAEMARENYNINRKRSKRLLIHRAASGIIFLLYILFAVLFIRDGHVLSKIILFLSLSLAAIWFGEELGSITGVRFGQGISPVVNTPSPGVLVRALGWVLLLIPFLLALAS